jgi:hypothetical protein
LIAANELDLQELIPYVESFLIKNKTIWMEQHFDLVYRTSFNNASLLGLQKFCVKFISKEPEKIFNLPNFSSIPEKLLVTVIQSDNLQMNEVQVWEHVLKWGLAQNLELSSDPTRFSKENISTLKNILQRCIPFIKFYNLNLNEFSQKVLPYKKILPKELYENLVDYFFDNDNKKSVPKGIKNININSKIITSQHAELISKWIDSRLKIKNKSISFKLLYRDSRDRSRGMYNKFKKFHEICKYQPHTVTIVKVNGNEILGGYNPIGWKFDSDYGVTKNSFIFSFNAENYVLSRVKDKRKAIDKIDYEGYYLSKYCIGPSFGNGDLRLYQNFFNEIRVSCNSSKIYKKQIREVDDSPTLDFELFQIVYN